MVGFEIQLWYHHSKGFAFTKTYEGFPENLSRSYLIKQGVFVPEFIGFGDISSNRLINLSALIQVMRPAERLVQ